VPYLAGDGAARDAQTGYFTIGGRIDDVLNVSGHRMGTMEIESALVSCTELVAEAAVVGRPDDTTGESICAFVVLKGTRPTGEEARKIATTLRNGVGQIMADQTLPFGDVTKMMAQFKLPGIDMAAIVEARRKDIEALVEANKSALESMQALAKKQTEMMSAAMQGMRDTATSSAGGVADPTKQAELILKGFEKTLAGMKELAEMARHAQSEAMAYITQHATRQMQDVKALMQPK
jgi:phasin family protein